MYKEHMLIHTCTCIDGQMSLPEKTGSQVFLVFPISNTEHVPNSGNHFRIGTNRVLLSCEVLINVGPCSTDISTTIKLVARVNFPKILQPRKKTNKNFLSLLAGSRQGYAHMDESEKKHLSYKNIKLRSNLLESPLSH